MPMVMDDELDDLFDERQLGEVAQISNIPVLAKGLDQRIDELRTCGCSQKIAWSNQGCIATIARDGRSVILQSLYCDQLSGTWSLSDGDEAGIITATHAGQVLKHLSWNHSGTELAVSDTAGNTSVYSVLVAVNRCSVSKRCVLEAEDNLSAVVGLAWLHQDRSVSTKYYIPIDLTEREPRCPYFARQPDIPTGNGPLLVLATS
ncbi:MAG: hypothetical protein Q9174_004164 [Haloplaca sp. 1 TL-2023]